MAKPVRRKWLETLFSKYRLVIMNDETFEEKASFRLSRINLFSITGTVLLLVAAGIASVFIFTPVKELIPGYADVNMRRDLVYLKLMADSIEKAIDTRTLFINSTRDVFTGKVDTVFDTSGYYDETTDRPLELETNSAEDSVLRAEMESEEFFRLNTSNIKPNKPTIAEFSFFPPVRGVITRDFSQKEEHFGIDIVAGADETIEAVLDGTVVLSSWTLETGYVLAIQHEQDMVTFYKHNAVLLKKTGNFVKAGDAIAIIGSSGELTSGPHLHFELWHKGIPIDPTEYIIFN